MNSLSIIKIQTPKKFLLDGFLFNQNNKKTFFIFVHGLGSNLFSQMELLQKIAKTKNGILTFNNRGNGIISKIKQASPKDKRGHKTHSIGMAHEVFEDCVDDIEGAVNYVEKLGAKNIFLVGHSTGCQKSIFYLSKKDKTSVKGAILLAPMSDFADAFTFTDKKVYQKAVAYAQKKVTQGHQHDLLPSGIWSYAIDAQRFLSLYTIDGQEEIFTYASGKKPTTIKKVKKPILVILAGDDEYRDRPMNEIADWFDKVLYNKDKKTCIVKNAPHNFNGYTEEVSKKIVNWTKLY